MKIKLLQKKISGFTLIEVLVALLVMSVGLLGLAALQATALKTNHSAYHRGQATFLAMDIIERMRANRVQAKTLAYDRNFADPIPAAGGTIVTIDLNNWLTLVSNNLPNGQASINCQNADGANGDNLCDVTIRWDEARVGGSATNGGTTDFFFRTNL